MLYLLTNILGGNGLSMSVEVGNIVEGKITGLANFGAFVDLGSGKNGLVHISEVSDKYIENINQELEEGQTVKVKVISVADDGKIALSIRKAQENKEKKKAPEQPKKKAEPKRQQNNNQDNNKSFDAMMNSFLKDSEDRLSSIRKNTEGKRGGRGSRRS